MMSFVREVVFLGFLALMFLCAEGAPGARKLIDRGNGAECSKVDCDDDCDDIDDFKPGDDDAPLCNRCCDVCDVVDCKDDCDDFGDFEHGDDDAPVCNRCCAPKCPRNSEYLISKVTGQISKDAGLKELSGMVASRRYPDVFYAIQDHGNPPDVYVLHKNGTVLGKIVLEGVKMSDFEDITIGPGHQKDRDYIYVGDIGNNWSGNCRGITYGHMTVYSFTEPDIGAFSYGTNGKIKIPAPEITTFVLQNPTIDSTTVCDDTTKKDFETLFVDPLSKDVYLVQKNKNLNQDDKAVTIFKFTPPTERSSNVITVELKNVGNLPVINHPISQNLIQSHLDRYPFSGVGGTEDRNATWPMFITAGDISMDGEIIVLRNYAGGRMWTRKQGQTVESALVENESCEILLRTEPQGEAIALKPDKDGYYTSSEMRGEGNGNSHVPIYYYPFW